MVIKHNDATSICVQDFARTRVSHSGGKSPRPWLMSTRCAHHTVRLRFVRSHPSSQQAWTTFRLRAGEHSQLVIFVLVLISTIQVMVFNKHHSCVINLLWLCIYRSRAPCLLLVACLSSPFPSPAAVLFSVKASLCESSVGVSYFLFLPPSRSGENCLQLCESQTAIFPTPEGSLGRAGSWRNEFSQHWIGLS